MCRYYTGLSIWTGWCFLHQYVQYLNLEVCCHEDLKVFYCLLFPEHFLGIECHDTATVQDSNQLNTAIFTHHNYLDIVTIWGEIQRPLLSDF